MKESEKLPNKIKISLEKGKLIDNQLNENDKLNLLINDCLDMENTIKNINFINDKAKKYDEQSNLEMNFFPENENDINLIEPIKNFGIIYQENNNFKDSIILNKNQLYINNIKNWANLNCKFEAKLLYQRSKNGDTYDIFHQLCDNQGTTLTLIKSTEGFIIGGYTSLSWDKYTNGWKNDKDTFLFSLTDNKVFKKRKPDKSIYCSKNNGPWFAFIGFRSSGKQNMTQGEFLYKVNENEIHFEDFNSIISNDKKNRFFDVEEVEVFKITPVIGQ
jgi:hypothetical protein